VREEESEPPNHFGAAFSLMGGGAVRNSVEQSGTNEENIFVLTIDFS
jgi:hypothetical protein